MSSEGDIELMDLGLWSLVFGLDYQVLTVVVSVTRVEVQDQRPTTTISLPP